MTATLHEADTPLLALSYSNRPERPAYLPPVDEHGFLLLVRQALPQLQHAQQVRRARGEVVHVFRDLVSGEFSVLFQRPAGQDTVKESGYPWLDLLNQLAGEWRLDQQHLRGGVA